MLSSVDGKIDGPSLRAVTGSGEYESTGAQLNGDAWVCGRETMQRHFAEDEPFVSKYRKGLRGLGTCMWRGGPNPMRSLLIPLANSGGLTVISTGITSSAR